MRLKFGNSCISMREVNFYKGLTRKNAFFEGWSWVKFSNLWLPLATNLRFYTSVAKGLKLKVRKSLGLISASAEVAREKLVGGLFAAPPPRPPPPPPSWIGLSIPPRECKVTRNVKDSRKLSNKEIYFTLQSNCTKYNKPFKFISCSNFPEEHHILSPDIWGKTCTEMLWWIAIHFLSCRNLFIFLFP